MSKIYTSISDLIGHTPLLELKGYEEKYGLKARILAKLEFFNPNQSIKDRIAFSMIETAEQEGQLHPGDTIVDVTSGNTGIGLAALAAAKGYRFRAFVQDSVSIERFKVLKAFGSETVKYLDEPAIADTLKATNNDFVEAVKALEKEVFSKHQDWFFINQLGNPSNPEAHYRSTGPEIWEDTDGNVDIFAATVGTGGTISGTGRYLKEQKPDVQVVAIQPGPDSIPTEENPAPEEIQGVHPFEGIPACQVPKVLDREIYDEWQEVETHQAYEAARMVARTDGILVGISSGAALSVARRLAERPENAGKTIVIIFPDTGLRYLSTNLFEGGEA